MVLIEVFLLFLSLLLCIISSYTDIAYGEIKNRLLLCFLLTGFVLILLYYGVFARDLLPIFLLNFLVSSILSFFLFYSNSFAGGDSKLIITLSLLYPAGMYLTYQGRELTLLFAIAFSIAYGFFFLLFDSVEKILTGKTKLGQNYITEFIKKYLLNYLTVLIYITGINLVFTVLGTFGIFIPSTVSLACCIIFSFIIPRIYCLKKRTGVLTGIVIDLVLSFYLRILPVSINPITYIITAFFLLAQMTIRTDLYVEIEPTMIRKGMILSSGTSLLLQNAKTKGLPGISSETLKDRLTAEEAIQIQQWAENEGKGKIIYTVRQIPFAIFIFLGYMTYFLIWSFTR